MHELSKRAFALAAGVLMAGGIVALTAGPAAAVEPAAGASAAAVDAACPTGTAESKTLVVKLTVRPDGGNGTGDGGAGNSKWATVDITRTTVLCRSTPTMRVETTLPVPTQYQAIVADDGTFTTLGGATLSPGKGKALTAGVTGHVKGGFTQRFTAATDFVSYKPYDDKVTHKGTAPATTPDWVRGLFGTEFQSAGIGRYEWKYGSCAATVEAGIEKWVDGSAHDGAGPNDGDITKACPVIPTPSASAPAVVIPPTSPAAGAGGGLPVTGFPVWTAVATGVVLLGFGGFLLVAAKRRKD